MRFVKLMQWAILATGNCNTTKQQICLLPQTFFRSACCCCYYYLTIWIKTKAVAAAAVAATSSAAAAAVAAATSKRCFWLNGYSTDTFRRVTKNLARALTRATDERVARTCHFLGGWLQRHQQRQRLRPATSYKNNAETHFQANTHTHTHCSLYTAGSPCKL